MVDTPADNDPQYDKIPQSPGCFDQKEIKQQDAEQHEIQKIQYNMRLHPHRKQAANGIEQVIEDRKQHPQQQRLQKLRHRRGGSRKNHAGTLPPLAEQPAEKAAGLRLVIGIGYALYFALQR